MLPLRRFSVCLNSSSSPIMAMKRENEEKAGNPAKKYAPGFWANGLLTAMNDPSLQVFSDSRVVVIKDKYPKAQFHYLVLPKESIPNLKAISNNHLQLLEHIHLVGCEIVQREEHKNINFKMGYHAEPSMYHLHMHIISDDLCSDCLKTKKHYNSFATDYFIDSKKLLECVKTTGKATIFSPEECKKLLQQSLVCFKCGEKTVNIPKLKLHLSSHVK